MTSITNNLPPLNGLILSGGKSTRMGKDKALLSYHGIPQLTHLTNLFKSFCDQVFVSAKHKTDYPNYTVIGDNYDIESPLNGILSAINTYPKNGWIVVACDMPLIDQESLIHLIGHRSEDHLATCYRNDQSMIEPLFSIWEPHSLKALLDFQAEGDLSPKRFLETHSVNIISPLDHRVLTNVNTLEEFELLQKQNQQNHKSSR